MTGEIQNLQKPTSKLQRNFNNQPPNADLGSLEFLWGLVLGIWVFCNYTLNLNNITSPSCTTYSLPSIR
jgi:hypothetical protein